MKCPKCGSGDICYKDTEIGSWRCGHCFYQWPISEEILTPRQRDLALLGECPWCEENIRGWNLLSSGISSNVTRAVSFQEIEGLEKIYPGIDIRTGHKLDCEHSDIKL